MGKLRVELKVIPLDNLLRDITPGKAFTLTGPVKRVLRIEQNDRFPNRGIQFWLLLDDEITERHEKALKKWEGLPKEEQQKGGRAPEPPSSLALMYLKVGAPAVEGFVLDGDSWFVDEYVFFAERNPGSGLFGGMFGF